MFEAEDEFYEETLARLVAEGILQPATDVILVLAGGDRDARAFRGLGFEKVTISNLDERCSANQFAPFDWSTQDCEALTFEDSTFDFCVIHNGLHHCRSPHQALLEMVRVARRGALLFEPQENLVTRLGIRLGFGQEFETVSVYLNDCRFGGVRNTSIPNFVYRLTSREIVKTVSCAWPQGPFQFRFFHQLRMPWQQLRERKNSLFLVGAALAWPALALLTRLFPTLANGFAALILRPDLPKQRYPWLSVSGDSGYEISVDWLKRKYGNWGSQ